MVNQKARNTAMDLRTAKRLLGHYQTEVRAAVRQLETARRALISFGRRLTRASAEGNELTVVQEVLAGNRPFNAAFVDSLKHLSHRRLQPLNADLRARRDELSRIVAERNQWKETRRTIRDRIRSERKAIHDEASKRLEELESDVVLGGELLRGTKQRLRPLKQELARRERGLLRWTQKTEILREQVEKLRQESTKHETNIRQSQEQLDEARNALAEARARLRPENDHPDLRESIEKLDGLSKRHKELKKEIDALKRRVTAVYQDFVQKATDLEKKFKSCSRALYRAIDALPSLCAPVKTSDSLWFPVDSDFDNWLAECQTRRAQAAALINSPLQSISSDDERALRDRIIRDLARSWNRIEQQREQAKERRAQQAQQARDRQKKRLREAQEQEKQRIKREQEIATENRRELRRAIRCQEAAKEAIEEFEREHRRLDNRIEQNSRARELAEERVEQILRQIFTRNPLHTPDYVRRNAPRFVAYDNAQARVDRLDTERQLLRRLYMERARLRRAKTEADQRVAAEVRSQSKTAKGKSGKAPQVEVNEWEDAERLAELYLRWLGYPDARRTNVGPDGGVDVESGRAVAQVKDQSNPVGRHLIQQIYGVAHSRNKKAFFFARRYAPQAVEWARENNVKLYQFNRAGVVTEVL